MNRQYLKNRGAIKLWFVPLSIAWLLLSAAAQATQLQHMSYSVLPGNAVQLLLDFDAPVPEPIHFTTDNPARLILDFPGTEFTAQRTLDVGIGTVHRVSGVATDARTRVVVSLLQITPFKIETEGKRLLVSLGVGSSGGGSASATPQNASTSSVLKTVLAREAAPYAQSQRNASGVTDIDFRRTENGAAQIVVTLNDPSIIVDMQETGRKINVKFMNANLPERLDRRLDVSDFATPVLMVDTRSKGKDVEMTIETTGVYEHLSYQADNMYTIQVQQKVASKEDEASIAQKDYSGEKLSLNFQNIDIHAVLKLLADFRDKNLIMTEQVRGKVTLLLKNVPWDQALDIILESKNLGINEIGNVWHIDLKSNLAEQRQKELESQKKIKELEPLRTEFIQVNYATAEEFAALIQSKNSGGEQGHNFLSSRGSVAVNSRTNTLLIQDTADKIEQVRQLVLALDKPVRQVLITGRVVVADDSFSRDLGVRFGQGANFRAGANRDVSIMAGGTSAGAAGGGATTSGLNIGAATIGSGITAFSDGMMVDLPATTSGFAAGLAIGKIGTYLLQLELSAMENEGRGEVVSSPRVITADQQVATIEQGVKVQVQGTAGANAAQPAQFVDATLNLTVTPRITPDDRVIMDLDIKKDVPSGEDISTRSLKTQVLVNNGETVVLGGVFEQTEQRSTKRVPFFGDLPIIGYLFRNNFKQISKNELLIFVTPKILKDNVSG